MCYLGICHVTLLVLVPMNQSNDSLLIFHHHPTLIPIQEGMFWGAESFNKPIGDWDVSSVTDMVSILV